jgi:2-keto-4-pentenoate hydratase/2-oxohepta-3-ene-1,7-dioic acid hydratase in catechol pathway
MAAHVALAGANLSLRIQVGNVWCVGRNYREHAAELGNEVPTQPIVFLKASSSIRALESGALAHADEEFHHEAELVLLLGAAIPLGGLPRPELLATVRGLGLGLDLTRRGYQSELKKKGLPWLMAKSFAGAAPVSEFVAEFDLERVEYSLDVNGERRQYARVSDMIFDVPSLLAHLAASHELRAGDLVFTGTPKGVGPMRKGDTFRLAFEQGASGAFDGRL